MKINAIIFLLYIILCSSKCFSQLKNDITDKFDFIKELNRKELYDSILLFNKSGFTDNNLFFYGVSFKENKIYKIKFNLRLYSDTMYSIKGRVKKNLIKINYKPNNFTNIFLSLNNDSLNHWFDDNTKVGLKVSDGTYYSILLIIPLKGIIKHNQAYMPYFYQNRYYTKDRSFFIELLNFLSDVHNINNLTK